MQYVYSTTTNDTIYNDYHPPVEGSMVREVSHEVLVKGGTGIANKNLVTPMGVVTMVSDEDAEFLRNNEAFKRHMAAGFVQIRRDEVNPEVAAAEMVTRDGSAPVVPSDYDENAAAKPSDGKPEKKMTFGGALRSAFK